MAFVISEFQSVRPAHLRSQAHTLDWLVEAHARAELTRAAHDGRHLNEERTRARMRAALLRFGCCDDRIVTRGYEIDDCEHTRWQEMEIYRLDENEHGAGAFARTRAFERITQSVMDRVLSSGSPEPPSDLFHVTCTGYAAPSAAQRSVARHGWGDHTRVTHVYHMGCYAAFPALRLARAAQSGIVAQPGAAARSRVVHTEVCSLHLDPSLHEPEQLVIHSLFADGSIAYDVAETTRTELRAPGLELLALLERTLPDSADAMTWRSSAWGMQMTLSRHVPERLGAAIEPFVTQLVTGAGLDRNAARDAVYAVHPGGPRILDRVQDLLRLADAQLEHSRKVLRERGNMSSATLPHIWLELACDRRVADRTPVVSLAFGPGLTICGAVLRKLVP